MPSPDAAPWSLSETSIRHHASAESFRRGQEYVRRGAVGELVRRGDVLNAEIEGSEPVPYEVRVTFAAGDVAAAVCTCPYDWGGWCKHIVAALLTFVDDPEAVDVRPALDEMLDALNHGQLRTLLQRLVERDAALVDTIARQIALLATMPGAADAAPSAVDSGSVRREVRAALHSLDRMRPSEAYWYVDSAIGGVEQVLEEAWALIRGDQGRAALGMLAAITDEYLAEWTMLDDSNGEVSAFFYELAPAWTEALLSADLTPDERAGWADKLDIWAAEIDEYGIAGVFDAAIQAAEQGWDGARLADSPRAAAPAVPSPWGIFLPDLSSSLTVARLNVLERRGRRDEFLRLAEATGHGERYATMLMELGRVDEAVAAGKDRFDIAASALALAQALHGRGHEAEAFEIAEHGLTLDGPKVALATWLDEAAEAAGRPDLARSAAGVAFREAPSLAAYQRVQSLAGDGWPELRDELLGDLRQMRRYDPRGQVEVYLHEGLIDDAIDVVEVSGDYRLIEQVAEAAVVHRPEWVIRTCRTQAESIMNEGRAQAYDHAVDWLTHLRAAYAAMGDQDEWDSYLADLLSRHRRKYKLVPMLKTLQP